MRTRLSFWCPADASPSLSREVAQPSFCILCSGSWLRANTGNNRSVPSMSGTERKFNLERIAEQIAPLLPHCTKRVGTGGTSKRIFEKLSDHAGNGAQLKRPSHSPRRPLFLGRLGFPFGCDYCRDGSMICTVHKMTILCAVIPR